MAKVGPNHIYCMAPACRRLKWQQDWRDKWTPMLQTQLAREAAWEAVRQRRARLDWLKEDGRFGNERWREAQRRALEREVATAVALSDELAVLVAQQERDAQFGAYADRRWELSLDVSVGDDASLLEFVDEAGRVRLGQRAHPDFTEALCALMDVKREIDEWASDDAA